MAVPGTLSVKVLQIVSARVIVLSLALSGLFACGAPDPVEQSKIHLKQSEAFQQQGQYRAALIESRNALRFNTRDMNVWLQRIELFNQLGRYSSALELIDKFGPNHPVLVLEKASALNAVKKHRSALEVLQNTKATFDESQTSYFHLYIGQAHAGMGKLEQARLDFQKAATGDASVEAMLGIARIEALSADSETAMAILRRVIANHPENTSALILAAEIAYYNKNYGEAEDYYSAALSYLPTTDIMLPERLKTLQGLSRVLTMLNRSHEALVYKRILAGHMPEHVLSRDRLQQNIRRIKEGKLDEAEEDLLAMIEAGTDAQAGTLLGIVNYMQGDLNEASDLLTTYLDPETANSQALQLLVSAKFQMDEIDQVLAILGPEVQSREDDASILGLYGLAMLAKNDLAGAKYVKRALKIDPGNSRLRLALVSYYQQQGQAEMALKQARLAYDHSGNSSMVQGALIQQLIASGLKTEAGQLATKIAAANPEDASSLTLAGLVFSRTGKADKALVYLKQAIAIEPGNATAILELARIALETKDYNVAVYSYAAVIALRPNKVEAYKGLVSAFEAYGDVDKALELLGEFSEKNPDNGLPLAVLAEYYLRHEEQDQAREAIEQASLRQANNAYIERVAIAVFSHTAQRALDNGDTMKARQELSLGLSYAPKAIPLLQQLARLEARDNKLDAALETIEVLKQMDLAGAFELRGDVLSRDDKVLALDAYRSAWAQRATSPLARKLYILLSDTDPQLAREFKGEWARRLPGDPGLLLATATEAQKKGDNKTAIGTYRKLLRKEPQNAMVLNNLAWLYYTEDDSRALELARQAADLSPDNPAILDTYAIVLIKDGQVEKGTSLLEKALQLSPNSEEIQSHLQQLEQR